VRGDLTALIPLTELVQDAIDNGLDEPLLRRIVDAYETWRRTVGKHLRPDDPRAMDYQLAIIRYQADPCAPMRKHVHASYEIRRRAESAEWRPGWRSCSPTKWSEPIGLGHHGRLRATGVRPEGATRVYVWGGSSADWAIAGVGRTSRTPVDSYPVDPFEGRASSDIAGDCRITVEPAESR